MTIEQILSVDPEVMGGTPVFVNTRVPVQSLIDHILAGDSLDYFLEGFPTVTRQQAEAFLDLAFHKAMSEVAYARAA